MPHYVSSKQFTKCRNAKEHDVERPTTGWDERDKGVRNLRRATVDCFPRRIPCEAAGGIPVFQPDSCCAIAHAPLGVARAQRAKPLADITNGLPLPGKEVTKPFEAFAESLLPRIIIIIYRHPFPRETRLFIFLNATIGLGGG
jgi:hypothetical protein